MIGLSVFLCVQGTESLLPPSQRQKIPFTLSNLGIAANTYFAVTLVPGTGAAHYTTGIDKLVALNSLLPFCYVLSYFLCNKERGLPYDARAKALLIAYFSVSASLGVEAVYANFCPYSKDNQSLETPWIANLIFAGLVTLCSCLALLESYFSEPSAPHERTSIVEA